MQLKQKGSNSNKKVATKIARDATEETSTEENVKIFNFLEENDLTDKQKIFCLYYVRSFNAIQAAINAGYSPVTSHVQGPRLFNEKSYESRNRWLMTCLFRLWMCLINTSKKAFSLY